MKKYIISRLHNDQVTSILVWSIITDLVIGVIALNIPPCTLSLSVGRFLCITTSLCVCDCVCVFVCLRKPYSGGSVSMWYCKVTSRGRAERLATRAGQSQDKEIQKTSSCIAEDAVPYNWLHLIPQCNQLWQLHKCLIVRPQKQCVYEHADNSFIINEDVMTM